jgi:myo-inositol-1(or 4)-monophosphatase
LNQEELLRLYEQAKAWTVQIGEKLRHDLQNMLDDDMGVEYKKSAADLVTIKDREVEQFFVEHINEHYPGHFIVGEEGMSGRKAEDPYKEVVWVIDPIDGTTNFVHQRRNFVISVGIYEQGRPCIGIIYDPIGDECFHCLRGNGAFLNDDQLPPLQKKSSEEALVGLNSFWLTPNRLYDHTVMHSLARDVRGTRSYGASALEMAYVACGRLDAYLTIRLHPWDFAGGLSLLEELGAKVTDIEGNRVSYFEPTSILVAAEELHELLLQKVSQ